MGQAPTDHAIIDFSKLHYTNTFKEIITYILRSSLHDSTNPILRHVYKNLLDIEQLMVRYFYGFFTDSMGQMKTYLYIAWVLCAYLVYDEQCLGLPANLPPIYKQLEGKEDLQVVPFNYTIFAV